MDKKNNLITNLQEVIKMKSTAIKPINSYTEVSEEKYVKEIIQSLSQKPSASSIKKNYESSELLRKARRG